MPSPANFIRYGISVFASLYFTSCGQITNAQEAPRREQTGPPNRERFIEHAFSFDRDGDGQLSREELDAFAKEFTQMQRPPEEQARQSVELPPHQASLTSEGEYRTLVSNGIPDHQPGRFPNRGNPNTIGTIDYRFRIPLNPKSLDDVREAGGALFGVALNGIPFDPGTAELWKGDPAWRYDAMSGKINLGLDQSNAHVQPNGAYHYHGLPLGMLEHRGKKSEELVLIGYAADGFPIYSQWGYSDPKDAASPLRKLRSSYQLRTGDRPAGEDGPGGSYDGTFNQDWEYVAGSGDLDQCNGRFSITPEYPQGTYHYVITDTFPFISRYFRGAPDQSFEKRRPPQRR